jgi:hypothetical protein
VLEDVPLDLDIAARAQTTLLPSQETIYWAKASSMLLTDIEGRDLPPIDNVRNYLLSRFPHGPANGRGICAQPRNPLKPNAVLRALLTDLDAWVVKGEEPPPDRVPRVTDGTLAPPLPQAGMGFSRIPGVVHNGVHHTGDPFDFGRDFDKGFLSVLPPRLLGTPYPVFVPKTDADGNDIAGVRVLDAALPPATYTGWALRADEARRLRRRGTEARLRQDQGRAARQQRSAPLARGALWRPRHLVREVRRAAEELKAQRFMLEEDVAATVAAAQAAAVPYRRKRYRVGLSVREGAAVMQGDR